MIENKCLRIWSKTGLMVELDFETGKLTYGPDYTPDEAARAFWEAFERFYPLARTKTA